MRHDFGLLFKEAKWNDFFDFSWEEVFGLFKNIPVTENYHLKWKGIDEEKIMNLLVGEHDFSEDRVKSQIEGLVKENKKKGQKGLGEFFG